MQQVIFVKIIPVQICVKMSQASCSESLIFLRIRSKRLPFSTYSKTKYNFARSSRWSSSLTILGWFRVLCTAISRKRTFKGTTEAARDFLIILRAYKVLDPILCTSCTSP